MMRWGLIVMALAACGDNRTPSGPDGGGVSCAARIEVSCGGVCVATLRVLFACEASGSHWTIAGLRVTPDDGVRRVTMTEYQCEKELSATWEVSHGTMVSGGVTADDPFTGVDFGCEAPPVSVP